MVLTVRKRIFSFFSFLRFHMRLKFFFIFPGCKIIFLNTWRKKLFEIVFYMTSKNFPEKMVLTLRKPLTFVFMSFRVYWKTYRKTYFFVDSHKKNDLRLEIPKVFKSQQIFCFSIYKLVPHIYKYYWWLIKWWSINIYNH